MAILSRRISWRLLQLLLLELVEELPDPSEAADLFRGVVQRLLEVQLLGDLLEGLLRPVLVEEDLGHLLDGEFLEELGVVLRASLLGAPGAREQDGGLDQLVV